MQCFKRAEVLAASVMNCPACRGIPLQYHFSVFIAYIKDVSFHCEVHRILMPNKITSLLKLAVNREHFT